MDTVQLLKDKTNIPVLFLLIVEVVALIKPFYTYSWWPLVYDDQLIGHKTQ